MGRLHHTLRRFACDDSGATAIEYALIAVGISIAIAGAVYSLGDTVLTGYFDRIANEYRQAAGG